jgi:hypothetical protein
MIARMTQTPADPSRPAGGGSDLPQPGSTPTAGQVSGPAWSGSIGALALLLGVGVIVPLVLGAIAGSLLIPHNDDPAFRRIALDLNQAGRLQLNGWSAMTLVGQIVYAQPFLWVSGGAAWGFVAAACVLAVAGIAAAFLLARRVLSVPRATLAVLAVLLVPGFLVQTTNFMTDVPTWGVALLCLLLGSVSLERGGDWRWFAASLAVGCFGFSIREFAAGALGAVVLVHAFSPAIRQRNFWIWSIVAAAACLGIYALKIHLNAGYPSLEPHLSKRSLVPLEQGFATLSLFVLPAVGVAAGSWWRRWHLVDALIGAGALAVVERNYVLSSSPNLVLGNMFSRTGSLGSDVLMGDRPDLFPAQAWNAVEFTAVAASLAFAAVIGASLGLWLRGRWLAYRQRGRRALVPGTPTTWTLIEVYAIAMGLGLVAFSFLVQSFDRYLWPLVLPVYALALRPMDGRPEPAASPPGPGLRRILAAAPSALAILLGIAMTVGSAATLANADAYDAARWHAGDVAVSHGYPAGTVDAGFEWVTFNADGNATTNPRPAFGPWYETKWSSFHLCVLVSNSEVSGAPVRLELMDTAAYRQFLIGPTKTLYLYRVVGDSACP